MILCGCVGKRDGKQRTSDNKKISVVSTIFPQYDWVREILGSKAENMDLTLLQNSNVDLHSYQPSMDDVVKISKSDLFIYVGGESDGWVEDALKKAVNPNMIVINLLETLADEAKPEEIVEGMEEEEEESEETNGEQKQEFDEHVWLSLRAAKKFCTTIADALSSFDSANRAEYQNNLSAYVEKLSALDAEYTAAIREARIKTLLFGDRFPFRYLADDYGITYYAAFPGCSAETEASFKTVIFLAQKMDELKLQNVMVTESSDQLIAKTIIDNTKDKNRQILVLNSMQSVGGAQNETKYLSVMESNLNILKQALK
jgi:zinc transport system substrate-binding protein